MKKFESTVVLFKEIGCDEAKKLVNEKINNNFGRYKMFGIEVAAKDNYVTEVTEHDDTIIVSVAIDYEGNDTEQIDLDMLLMDGDEE